MAASKVAVVVGVGPGLGSAVARKFAREGYKTALMSRRMEALTPVQQEIVANGGTAICVPCNAGSPGEVAAAFQEVQSQLGAPQVLVYNAGPGIGSWPPPGIMQLKPEDFSRAFDVGVVGGLTCAQQVLPAMVEAGAGTLIFTGATASLRGSARFAQLAAPKFALRGLAQSMAREFQPQGIHVAHVIVDGVIDLPRTRSMMPDRPEDSFLSPDAMAESYWHLHCQDHTAWTHELDLRPYTEKW